MFKKLIIAALVLTICLNLSGCSQFNDSDALLRPPNFSGEYTAIYNALESSVQQGDKISLHSPQSGEYRSSIILQNYNDSLKQAIAFYESGVQKTLSGTGLRMGVFSELNGNWTCNWDLPCDGEKVDKVMFLKDESNIYNYMIVGYSSEKQTQKNYCIYNFNIDNFHMLYAGEYQAMEVCDINEDGINELITIGHYEKETNNSKNYTVTDKTKNSHYITSAVINSISNDHITLWGETQMSGNILNYTNISFDHNSFGKPTLFIDEQITKTTYGTEVLIYENNSLKNIILENNMIDQTIRYQVPISYDINKNGIIEIPHTKLFPGYDQNSASPIYITNWRKFQNGKLVDDITTYVNYSQGFGITLPKQWEGKVSAKNLYQNDEIEFFVYHDSLENDKEKLLRLRIDSQNNKNNIPFNYFVVRTDGPILYLANLSTVNPLTDPTLSISPDQVKNQFFTMYINSNINSKDK